MLVFKCLTVAVLMCAPSTSLQASRRLDTRNNKTSPTSNLKRGIFFEFIKGQVPTCICGRPNRNSRMLGGEFTGTNEFPWMSDVITRENMAGAGSLVNDRYVVTAATLLLGMTPYDVKVTLGMHDRCTEDKTSIRYSVDDIRMHENFDAKTRANDIAILRLSTQVKFQRTILPVCLPAPGTSYTGQVATIVTWGQDEDEEDGDNAGEGGEGDQKRKRTKSKPTKKRNKRQQAVTPAGEGEDGGDEGGGEEEETGEVCRQRKVGLPVLERSQCESSAEKPYYVTRDKGCAGLVNVPSIVCTADAGGPVMFRSHLGIYELIGVLSASNQCEDAKGPSLYTRVADFRRWILYNTRDAQYCSV